MFNLCTLLSVRNGEKYIFSWLEHTEKFSDLRIIYDDCSTDGTVKLIDEYIKKRPTAAEVILIRGKEHLEFNDLNNRNIVLDELYKYGVQWALWLDIDEKILENQINLLNETIEHANRYKYDCIMQPMVHLWDSENTFRTDFKLAWCDGIEPKTRLWRIQNKVKLFLDRKLHFCLVPDTQERRYISDIFILHYGYMERKERVNKYSFYKQEDKIGNINDTAASNYEYMLDRDIKLLNLNQINAELLIKYRKEIENW